MASSSHSTGLAIHRAEPTVMWGTISGNLHFCMFQKAQQTTFYYYNIVNLKHELDASCYIKLTTRMGGNIYHSFVIVPGI